MKFYLQKGEREQKYNIPTIYFDSASERRNRIERGQRKIFFCENAGEPLAPDKSFSK